MLQPKAYASNLDLARTNPYATKVLMTTQLESDLFCFVTLQSNPKSRREHIELHSENIFITWRLKPVKRDIFVSPLFAARILSSFAFCVDT